MRTSSSCSWRPRSISDRRGSRRRRSRRITTSPRPCGSSPARTGRRSSSRGARASRRAGGLIQRFSEDIDIFLDPDAYTPKLGKRPIDRELEKLRDAVAAHPGLTLVVEESRKIGGIGRDDYFAYTQLFPGRLRPRVLLEAGTASGRQPTEDVPARVVRGRVPSRDGQLRGRRGRGTVRDAAPPFPADLRREALHDPRQDRAVPPERQATRHLREALLRPLHARPTGRGARDAAITGVRRAPARLRSREPGPLPEVLPPARGDAFRRRASRSSRQGRSKEMVAREYEAQCELLCFGGYPRWEEVESCFETIRAML